MSLARWWEGKNDRYSQRVRFWRTLPKTSLLLLYLFVFLIFCTLGVLTSTTEFRALPWWMLLIYILVPGIFAIGYVYMSAFRHWMWVFPIMILQFGFYSVLGHFERKYPSYAQQVPDMLRHRLVLTLIVGIFSLMGSYSLMLTLFTREGKRYFRVHAEMQLAAEIHRALVPLVEFQTSEFEVYGLSLPSGEVGGDLVDGVSNGASWTAYLADVSGHGVSSGVLMAMLKSATRMSMRHRDSVAVMLDEVNQVFHSLRAPNTFATFAAVSFQEALGVEVLVAGHLPILHCDGARVTEIDTPGLPVGIMPDSSFVTARVEMRVGDVLAIVTDGLTEVFDKKEQELGSEYIKEALRTQCGRPLEEIATGLLAQAAQWGKRSDDQSLLLVRRIGEASNSHSIASIS